MNRLRLWVTVLIVWLIFIFNIERINSPINIRSYTYIFVAIAAVVAILPKADRWSYLAMIIIPVPSFLLFKAIGRGQSLLGPALPLTVTQVMGIAVTGLISRQISIGLREVEKLVNEITSGYLGKAPKSFSEAQSAIYRELRRARLHHRPLSVITLKIDEKSVQVVLPKLVSEIQQAMMNEYVLAGITRVLDKNVSDFGTIARRGNYFVVVLPEVPIENAPDVASKLQKAVQQAFDVKLFTGTASFPDEAVTFEALVRQAMDDADEVGVSTPLQEGYRPDGREPEISSQRLNL